MKISMKKVLLISLSALVALTVNFLTFEIRYVWHLNPGEAWLLRSIYGACVVAIVMLWVIFPSRVLVLLVGLFGLFFPVLLQRPGVAALNGGFVWFVLLSLALLAGTTELRRRRLAKMP